jgi:hypothetical protein
MKWQAEQPKDLPDKVLADIIAKRIVAKKPPALRWATQMIRHPELVDAPFDRLRMPLRSNKERRRWQVRINQARGR